MKRLGTLATGAGLLLAGAWEGFMRTGNEAVPALFLSSGFLFLGAWLALEVLHVHDHHNDNEESDGDRD